MTVEIFESISSWLKRPIPLKDNGLYSKCKYYLLDCTVTYLGTTFIIPKSSAEIRMLLIIPLTFILDIPFSFYFLVNWNLHSSLIFLCHFLSCIFVSFHSIMHCCPCTLSILFHLLDSYWIEIDQEILIVNNLYILLDFLFLDLLRFLKLSL